jgi:hypothetical protein
MNEKPSILLLTSAVVYFAAAVPLLFAPDELLAFAGGTHSTLDAGLLQVIGSAVFGFALLNWMHRYSRVGGIFGRPVVASNFAHAGSAALLLGHIALRVPFSPALVVVLGLYACLAVSFGAKFFVGVKFSRDPATPREP